MTELQEKVLSLLLEIDEICRRNEIEYYLAAGSALGAVRHHGFLPWDDDADIYMTADNWKKFLSVKDQLPEGRTIVTVDEGDFSSEYTINRYVDLTSTRLYRYLTASPQPAGLTVDIIILDPVPKDAESIKDYVVSLTEYADYLVVAAAHGMRCPYKLNDREIWAEGERIGRINMIKKLKARAEKYDGTKGGVMIQRDPTVPHVWDEDVFGKPVYVPFEHTEMPVASKQYLQLTGAFNEDWMYVPETVDRQEHIKGVIFDISSNNPFGDYSSRVDMEEMRDAMVEITSSMNFMAEDIINYRWSRLALAACRVRMIYKRKGFDSSLIENYTVSRDHEALDSYYKEYEAIQCDKEMIGNVAVAGWLMSQKPFYIDIEDEFLYWFLRNLMHRPMLGKARVILQGRIDKGDCTEVIKELENLIRRINTLTDMVDAGEYKKALDEIRPLYEKYPENLRLMQLYFGCRYYLASSDEERKKLEAEIRQLPKCDYEDSVVQVVLADILYARGDSKEALDIYEQLAEETTHGLVLLHIKELFAESQQGSREQLISMKAEFKAGSPIEIDEEDGDSLVEDHSKQDDFHGGIAGEAEDREDD